jgi:nucleotide-binding universal stress UspA family protein
MYKSLLVPVDLSHGDVVARIVKLAREIAGPEGTVTALHVIDAVPSFVAAEIPDDMLKNHRMEVVRALEAEVHAVDPTAKIALRQGVAATAILEAAAELKLDAIVLGSHRPGLRDYLIGSTAARVVRHAPCSVIVDRG